MKKIGKITHYFTKIGVGVVKLSGTLRIGDKIRVRGKNTDFEQKLDSMQIDKGNIEEAKKGQEIGMKVKERVRKNDKVFKVE